MTRKNNLYEVLGIDKTSDKQVIKNGFRRMAKKHHPDKEGGSKESFALVKHAHDILMDDKARKKYDSTGDDTVASPDNSQASAVNLIAQLFNAILQECSNQGKSPLEIDIISGMKMKLSASLDEPKKQIRILTAMLVIDKKMIGRFNSKKKNDVNVFNSIVQNRIETLNKNIEVLQEQVIVTEMALKILNDVYYNFDSPSHPPSPMHAVFGSW